MKKFKLVVLALILIFAILAMFLFGTQKKEINHKPIVSVSTFFIYDIVKHIAGTSVEIVNMIPFGVDPHSFEITPKIMAGIEKSSLVFLTGAGLEPWSDHISFKSKSTKCNTCNYFVKTTTFRTF